MDADVVIRDSKGEATPDEVKYLRKNLIAWRDKLIDLAEETGARMAGSRVDYLKATVGELPDPKFRQIRADYESKKSSQLYFKVKIEERLREVQRMIRDELDQWRRLTEFLYDTLEDIDGLRAEVPEDLLPLYDQIAE